ncbi:MAG: 16S rRNA (guanine(966)-N(2))-methyltransferase RsmD [Lachnospiraceae bacterium]|nr:16S rRNA (guanine(966)-N(2))-methyltransferase RsmD [Lachnospiraceae bacterium]
MRVIAGTARSMPLRTVKGMDVRPTTDRTKETLFNILMPLIPGCRFLDLYAGSGSIGIEALSRGCASCTFVEKNRIHQNLILENLAFTHLEKNARLIRGDVDSALMRLEGEEPYDIIFMDPPFNQKLEKGTLAILSKSSLPAEGGVIVVEASPKTDFSYLDDLGFEIVKERRYGQSRHIILKKLT